MGCQVTKGSDNSSMEKEEKCVKVINDTQTYLNVLSPGVITLSINVRYVDKEQSEHTVQTYSSDSNISVISSEVLDPSFLPIPSLTPVNSSVTIYSPNSKSELTA